MPADPNAEAKARFAGHWETVTTPRPSQTFPGVVNHDHYARIAQPARKPAKARKGRKADVTRHRAARPPIPVIYAQP